MIITVQQGTMDSKQHFLDTVEALEKIGYKLFSIKCYDTQRKLADVLLIKDVDKFGY